MKFEIAFTQTAAEHLRSYRKFDQRIILDSIDEQLSHEPMTETRNRKRLSENEMSDWELRVQDFRVFYDVVIEDGRRAVKIKAVGHKEQGVLRIGDREVQL
jgi:mRNA-degrading endonuclease RelE of RelBE toxin-antitoxin system